jgi:CelD/BcsL family acetyltransferase involved in cellulose biosynthesis
MTPEIALSAEPEPATNASTASAELTIEIRSDLDLSPEDAHAYRLLVEQRPHVGVFVSRPWLAGFFAEPPDGFAPRLAIIREGRQLRGVVPLGMCREARRTRITLLGGGAGSDRVDMLAERGCEARCADALLAWLAASFGTGGYILELRDVPWDSALWGALHRLDNGSDVALAPRDLNAGPYLNLREPLPRASGGIPDSLMRHRRRLERRGRLRIDLLREPGEAIAAFDTLVRLLHERWHAQGSVSALDDPYRQRYHRRVIPLLLDAGYLRMARISVDLRPVAIGYGLMAGGWWGSYQVAYDREWATSRLQLGRLALGFGVELATQEGALEFDFLKGAERIKYFWPVHDRITIDADVYSRNTAAQATRAARAAQDLAVALVNSARHLIARR